MSLPAVDNLDVTGRSLVGLLDSRTINVASGSASPIATGLKAFWRPNFAGTITKVSLMSDVSCTAVMNIWKDTFANHPATVADKITASAPPTLTAALHSEDSTLTGWSKSFSAGDVFAFNVDSNDNAKILALAVDFVHA